MGRSSSTGHIAEDHVHTDITCNIEEPQQKYMYRFETASNRLLGRGEASVIDYWGKTMLLKSAPKNYMYIRL